MNPGDILLIKFPFTSLDSDKKRPVLLMYQTSLTENIQLLTVAMITSKIDGLTLVGDVMIQDWQASGLLHPSLVRLAKMATVEAALAEKRLGKIGETDLRTIKTCFQRMYKFWNKGRPSATVA